MGCLVEIKVKQKLLYNLNYRTYSIFFTTYRVHHQCTLFNIL